MKKHIMMFAAVAAVISCNNVDEIFEPQTPEVTINAGHTKTVVHDGVITWEGNEEITALFTKENNSEFHTEKFTNTKEAGNTAKFVGRINSKVHTSKGWDNAVYCIYPSTSVNEEDGAVMHTLPAEQYAHAGKDGSFASGLNIAYAKFPLSDLEQSLQGNVMFKNALTALRMTPGSGDIMSITVNGSAPLTGIAPMVFDNDGKLVLDVKVQLTGNSSVVLKPAEGKECFTEGVTYNILVYPGEHETFSVTLNYKDCGDYTRTLKTAPTLEPSMYYVIGFNSNSNDIIVKLEGSVSSLEERLPTREQLEQLEESVHGLESQIQSVTLLSEYLDNAAYASYSDFGNGKKKKEISLDYIIKPESAARALVKSFESDPSIVSAFAVYQSSGAPTYSDLSVTSLSVSDVEGFGAIVTATINTNNVSDDFYNGQKKASVAIQIKSDKSNIISDFANLVAVKSSGLDFTKVTDIPVIKGMTVSIPFKFAPNGEYELSVSGNGDAYIRENSGLYTGYVYVNIKDSDLASQSVVITLTSDDGVVEQPLTFTDAGTFDISTIPVLDCIGGEFSINVDADWSVFNKSSYDLQISNNMMIGQTQNYAWLYETTSGVKGSYTAEANSLWKEPKLDSKGDVVKDDNEEIVYFTINTGEERTAKASFSVKINDTASNGDLTFRTERVITQKAEGKSSDMSNYYSDGQILKLNTASPGYTPLNIVILGDGYQLKDLMKGGKFERNARSAMSTFFSIEPYKTFMDRFDVYMVAYKSNEAGTDIRSESVVKDTYFNTYFQGNTTECYVGSQEQVINVVKEVVGLSSDSKFYRTIVMMIVNTDQNAGSTGYGNTRETTSDIDTYGEPYRSFAIAVVPSNSTGTNGLIKHEAGGHAFGRLGDEYYTGAAVTEAAKSELATWHSKGWYRNICTSKNYWDDFTRNGYGSDEVDYHVGAWNYSSGEIYRSTDGGMMQNNVGVFNAPCRWYIYQRIRRQSEGYGDYWSDFLEYDWEKNRNL